MGPARKIDRATADRGRRRAPNILVAVALASTALALVAPSAGAVVPVTSSPFPLLVDPADGARPLPVGPSVDTVVDPVHGHVFVSTWMPHRSVIVTDLAGTVVKVITDLPNPRGMALGADGTTLFVALADGDAVAAIDLASLTERHRISTGPSSCPQWLASAAGRLWVSYGCSGQTGAVAPLDTTADLQILPDVANSRYPTPPRIGAASPSGRILAAAWGWKLSSVLDVFDVSGPTPVVMASRDTPEGLVQTAEVAVSPDGSIVFVAGIKMGGQLGRYGVLSFASSDLSDRGFYDSGPYIGAVAVSPDGLRLALAVDGGDGADFLVFPVGTYTPTHVREFDSSSPWSVAWSPDGSTAYMPDSLPDARPVMRLFHGLDVDPGRVEVSAPAGVQAAGAPVALAGALRTTDGTPTTGLVVDVTRSGPDGTRSLPPLTTRTGGAFSLTDVPPGGGGYTYRFTWPGDTTHPPATASGSVRVDGPPRVALRPPPAGPGSDRVLGLDRYGELVVDELHQRLLVSAPNSGTVAVLDLDGSRVGTIAGLPGVEGLALSHDGTTLYAAVGGASAIAAIDTDRLVEVGRWSTLPFGQVPVEVGVAGGQVFFGYRWTETTRSGWGSFRASAPAEVPTWDHVFGPLNMATFATSTGDPDLLITGVPTGMAFRMNASTTPPTLLARNLTELLPTGSKLSPDGKHVLRRGASVLDAATMTPLSDPRYSYGTGIAYAGAYTADGAYVAAGVEISHDSAVQIWPRAGGAPIRTFAFHGTIPFKGVAFTSDTSRLYTVTTDTTGGNANPVMHVRNWPLTDQGWSTPGDVFHPLEPARILETRWGFGAPSAGPIGAGATLTLQVTGRGGVPPTGVSAVVLNLTAVDPTAEGHLTAWPADGGARPLASNVNVHPARTVANLAVVKVGPTGAVNLFNAAGRTDVVTDVAGWYGKDAASGTMFTGLTPARIVDTRFGTGAPVARLNQDRTLPVQVTGRGGVPATGVSAVVLNVTVVDPSAPEGYLTAWPAGLARPYASNLNFYAGQTVPNVVVAKVGDGGVVNVYNSAGLIDVVVDVTGWYGPEGGSTGSGFSGVPPARILDTRYGNGAPLRPVDAGATLSLQVTGRGGIPATGVAAVALNVTAVNPTATSFVTAWPAGVGRPLASNLNLTVNRTVANMVFVKVGTGGAVNLYNAAGRTDVVVDVAGWYAG